MKLTEIPGVGPKTEALFMKLGINDCESLTRYYPLHYDIYNEPVPVGDALTGSKITVKGTVKGGINVFPAGNKKIVSCEISDGSGSLRLVWYNALFIRSVIKKGNTYYFRGIVSVRRGAKVMDHPEIFQIDQYEKNQGALIPIYGLTKGLSNNTVTKAVRAAFKLCGTSDEYLPEQIVRHYALMDEKEASEKIHFPADRDDLFRAGKRIAFDEFFFFILALRMLKSEEKRAAGLRVLFQPDEEGDGGAAPMIADVCASIWCRFSAVAPVCARISFIWSAFPCCSWYAWSIV